MKSVKIWWWGLLTVLGMVLSSTAQVMNVQHDFAGSPTDGSEPGGVLMLNGTIYGASTRGGIAGYGTLFSYSTNGGANYTILHVFTNQPDGALPNDLISDGNYIYGTTRNGSTNSNGYGTIFRISTNGSNYQILWSFTNLPDGEYPMGVLAVSGTNLFGTTSGGGSNNMGTVFQIGTNGSSYKILHHFLGGTTDGNSPQAGLILVGTNLYGTTYYGGTSNLGTAFKISTNGAAFSIIHSFTNTPDGEYPSAELVYNNNTLFGVTLLGGGIGSGTVFRMATNGASYSVLYNFSLPDANNVDGDDPSGSLTVNSNLIYGTAYNSGIGGSGTIFQMSTNGTGYTVLRSFTNSPDGANPSGALALSGKTLFGMTSQGGSTGNGLAFSLILSPVITSQPQSQTVTLGNPFSFDVEADGADPLKYQWYFHTNTLLANATNATLSYASASNTLAGTYSVVITNSYGSITSSFAILTVVTSPPVVIAPVFLGYNINPADGSFSLSISNVASSTNRLWASTNLVSSNFWQVIATNVQAANGLWLFTDTNAARTNAARFYRLSTP